MIKLNPIKNLHGDYPKCNISYREVAHNIYSSLILEIYNPVIVYGAVRFLEFEYKLKKMEWYMFK